MAKQSPTPGIRGTSVKALILVIALLPACTAGSDDAAPPAEPDVTGPAGVEPSEPQPGDPMPFKVLVFNVEYGGDETTDAVIADIDADVVGVLESYQRLPEMAEATGYPYHNLSLQLLSKYPIHEPSGADGRYALIEVRPGYVVAFFNIHLDYVRYGPRLLRRGRSVEEVIASENEVRMSALEVPLRQMQELIERGYPVFFTGDHNQPSSLDYTEETIGSRPDIEEPVPWPVSEALFDLGFRDTYREIHPDPLEHPGITHPGTGDRIDYIYATGSSHTLDSELVGEEGGEGVDRGFDPWTSDHRAIVSSFEVTPVTMPIMVSVDHALLMQGDPLTVSYNGPSAGGSVAIVPSESDIDSAEVTEDVAERAGRFEIDTAALAPGGYDAVLVGAEGSEIARVEIWVRDPAASIRVSTDKETYEVGEPIIVRWTDGPANRWDWIGVYTADEADPEVDYYLIWNYTALHASGTLPPTVEGSVLMDETAQGRPWPLPPDEYVVHYLLTDDYVSAGSAAFEVVG
jgi:hypothetical protein